MSECEIFNRYQARAEETTSKLNTCQTIDEKITYAQELLDLEKELEVCYAHDDPKCRLQRRVVVTARRKLAETIISVFSDLKRKI